MVGSVDDDGVGIGYVNTILYDGCREQHVIVVVLEIEDNLLQFLRLHLSVAYGNTCVRHVLMYQLADALQVVDARIDEIHLTVARHLEVYGVCNNLSTKGMYLRLDGIAVGRRCLDDAQVAGSHQRELQGTWYGRCRHCQRVYVGLHLAQFLFGRHTELLFLVDNQQPQVLELDTLAYQLVRTYQYVNLAVCQIFQDGSGLLGCTGSRQIFHPYRQVLQTTGEGLVMLISQHRCRHQYSHLL